MAEGLHLTLTAPEGEIFDGIVAEVELPTPGGPITLLPEHMQLVTAVSTGVISVQHKGGERPDHYAIGSGMLAVTHEGAQLTVEAAEHATKIDELEARKAVEEAKAKLDTQLSDEEVAFTHGNLERHLARLEAFERHKHYSARH